MPLGVTPIFVTRYQIRFVMQPNHQIRSVSDKATPHLQDMLRGINTRILVGNSNWARHVASKLFNHWRQNAIWKFSDPPFLVAKEEDAAVVYSQLPSLARSAELI